MLNPNSRGYSNFETDYNGGGVYGYFPSDEIPNYMKIAQMELALDMLKNDRFAGPDTSHANTIGLGKLSISIDKNTTTLIPDSIMTLIKKVYSRNKGYGPVS